MRESYDDGCLDQIIHHGEMQLCMRIFSVGLTQLILDCLAVNWSFGGQLAIPTKTPLAVGQFSGSFWRVPFQVLRNRLTGRALFWYLNLLVHEDTVSFESLIKCGY